MLCTNAMSGVSYSILWKTFLRLSYIFGDQLFQGSLYCYGCYLPPNWLMTFKAREWDGWVFGKIPSTESPKCSWSLGFQLGQFHLLVPPVDLQENSQSRNREHLLKIHIKSTRRCHRKPNRRAIINISMNNKRQRGCGEKGTLCWRGCELTQPLWKTVWGFLKKTRIKPPKREVQILRINAHKESIKMGLMSLFAGHQWRHTHREQTCGHGGGKVKVGSMQRITWKDTLSCVKQMSNGHLLCDSGNSNQCSVTMSTGKAAQRHYLLSEWSCSFMSDSLKPHGL